MIEKTIAMLQALTIALLVIAALMAAAIIAEMVQAVLELVSKW